MTHSGSGPWAGKEVIIRQLNTAGEIKRVLVVFDDAFPRPISSRVADLRRYAEKLRDRGVVFAAECEGATLGFVAFYSNDTNSLMAFLAHIAVDELARGMGIGRMLLRVCVDVARDAGMKALTLEVDSSNVTAISFYESLGFSRIGPASPGSCFMLSRFCR